MNQPQMLDARRLRSGERAADLAALREWMDEGATRN